MFGFLRALAWLVFLLVFLWFGSSVKIGDHTLFGHLGRIWRAKETQDLVDSTKDKAGPTLDRFKRGVEKGVEEAQKDDVTVDAGQPDAALPKPKRRGKE